MSELPHPLNPLRTTNSGLGGECYSYSMASIEENEVGLVVDRSVQIDIFRMGGAFSQSGVVARKNEVGLNDRVHIPIEVQYTRNDETLSYILRDIVNAAKCGYIGPTLK